ncbi:unnamed protein product [Lota lota]
MAFAKLLVQHGEYVVRTHHVEYGEGGILDMDDPISDLLEDKDRVLFTLGFASRWDSPGGPRYDITAIHFFEPMALRPDIRSCAAAAACKMDSAHFNGAAAPGCCWKLQGSRRHFNNATEEQHNLITAKQMMSVAAAQ